MSTLTLYRDPFAAAFDDVVRGFLTRPVQRQQAVRAIRFDVAEQDNAYVVTAELPGYKKEDVQVEIDGARVSITAESKAEKARRWSTASAIPARPCAASSSPTRSTAMRPAPSMKTAS